MTKGAICKTARVKERGRNLFISLTNCKFDKGFDKAKSNSIQVRKFIVDVPLLKK